MYEGLQIKINRVTDGTTRLKSLLEHKTCHGSDRAQSQLYEMDRITGVF
jgi:hypothetical protein